MSTVTASQPAAVPARVPLIRLATDGRTPILARIVHAARDNGPEPVAVAAFQSSV